MSAGTSVHVGKTPLYGEKPSVTGGYVHLLGEPYYRISHYDQMPPFFMSLVSSADHWLFIASSGGLTAGRTNPESALFPYETEDKITAHSEETGPKTILRVTRRGHTALWEPFSTRYARLYRCERHLYKNIYGNKLLFEEINHDLQLSLRYAWRSSDRFGFVKSSWLQNMGEQACQVVLLDGLQNLLPYGVTSALQNSYSSLLNGYKRNELEPASGLGIFALSATLTDRAEPSESLQATVAWQVGLNDVQHLLCSEQLDDFRAGRPLVPEVDVRGKAGAYLVVGSLQLPAAESRHWHMVANVNQDSAALVALADLLGRGQEALTAQLEQDIARGTAALVGYVAAADGLQRSAHRTTTVHHFANVLFNVMRGGIFADGYRLSRGDLLAFVQVRNRTVLAERRDWFAALPEGMTVADLHARAAAEGTPDLIRLCYEYLPLTFSRRHGDPSRPWNRFTINLKQADGSPRLDYQGNWRDIFQNWEPLALSFPAYVISMIARFLNATTADGYNPYRITRAGIEWEVPEPDNPWANIGYWSDHQIIYLQKLLEIAEQVQPGLLRTLWNRPIFAYANVPYRLRPYEEMLADWYNTIDFDWERELATEAAVASVGTDGRLLRDGAGHIVHGTMLEKLLSLLLAKIANLVPEGGIWMNTQRPEWNDANNALVGKGLSVVTAAYLRRFVTFWQAELAEAPEARFEVNAALATLFAGVQEVLSAHRAAVQRGFDDRTRRAVMDGLGRAATAYRATVYQDGVPAARVAISRQQLQDLLALVNAYIEQTLHANRRQDGLYHAYNILRLGESSSAVDHLYAMLEGQVAILSAGLLPPTACLALLQSLRSSALYRADQHTYILYPDRQLPGFLHKNQVTASQVAGSALVAALTAAEDRRLLIRDQRGVYHFHGSFRNSNDAVAVLDQLAQEPAYAALVTAERSFVLDLFEATFDHRSFTGRSGTFFAYEGLGSIYWHMVAKLLLAVQECYRAAEEVGADPAVRAGLKDAYSDIRQGLGFNKSPAEYGAFPTDPYSHTPAGGGARQPGMTGQVKEEILTRLGELGVSIRGGALHLAPTLLQPEEFLAAAEPFDYVDVHGRPQTLAVPADALAFTFCQVPVIYTRGSDAQVEIFFADGSRAVQDGSRLDRATSARLLARDGVIRLLQAQVVL